ncbi:MAG: hypothetical protein PHP35_02330 [Candidatus Colwellbacteria bacterium]|nr:hypothetical protein [Candidatus Colwellbacteria bacterium]
MNKRIFYIIAIAAIIPLFNLRVQASTIESAVKNLDSSLNQFVTAKDDINGNQLSPEEDLAYRKKVVTDALALSLKEISELRNKLDSFDFSEESTETDLKKQYLSDLDAFESVYKEFRDKLNEGVSVDDVKDIAKRTRDYRDETYTSGTEPILDFVFAFQTNRLADNAEVRHSKIDADIKKLEKANFIEKDYFMRQMTEAGKYISDAKGLVNKAKDMILNPQDNEDKDSEDESSSAPTPRELCEAALVNLKSAYSIFVNISGTVKKLIK